MVMALAGTLTDWQNAALCLSSRPALSRRLPQIAANMTGYLARHWRGQLPLAQSLWVNGLVSLLPFAVWFAFVGRAIHAMNGTSQFVLLAVLPFLILFLIDAWGAVGIWRCAGKQTIFGRKTPAWAVRGAQAVVVANVVAVVAAAVMIADQSRARLRGPQTVAPVYEVTLRGNTSGVPVAARFSR